MKAYVGIALIVGAFVIGSRLSDSAINAIVFFIIGSVFVGLPTVFVVAIMKQPVQSPRTDTEQSTQPQQVIIMIAPPQFQQPYMMPPMMMQPPQVMQQPMYFPSSQQSFKVIGD